MLRCFVSFGRCAGSTDHIHDEAHVSGAREGFVSRPRTQCGRSLQLIEPVLCVMNLPGHLSVRCCQSAPIDLRMLCLCRHSVLNAGARFASSLPPASASGTAATTGPPMGWSRRCYHRVRTLWSVPFRDSVDSVPFSWALMSCLGCKDRLGAVPSEPVP